MKYFYVNPPAAGDPDGDNTVGNFAVRPPVITKLNFILLYWPGDVLIVGYTCYLTTVSAMEHVKAEKLTGASFDQVEITTSEDIEDLCPDVKLPELVWMKIGGKPGRDDFGISKNMTLVMSERALKLFQRLGIPHAEIEDFDGM